MPLKEGERQGSKGEMTCLEWRRRRGKKGRSDLCFERRKRTGHRGENDLCLEWHKRRKKGGSDLCLWSKEDYREKFYAYMNEGERQVR